MSSPERAAAERIAQLVKGLASNWFRPEHPQLEKFTADVAEVAEPFFREAYAGAAPPNATTFWGEWHKQHPNKPGQNMLDRMIEFAEAYRAVTSGAAPDAELVSVLTQGIVAARSIMWMAKEYAEAGGSHGPEMRDYTDAEEKLASAERILKERG